MNTKENEQEKKEIILGILYGGYIVKKGKRDYNDFVQFNRILESVKPILLKSYLGELKDQEAESIIKEDIKQLRKITKKDYLLIAFENGIIKASYLMKDKDLEENIATLEEIAKKGDILTLDLKYNCISYLETNES